MSKLASYTMELRRVCDIYGRQTVENWFKDYNIANYLTPLQIEQIEKFGVWSKDRLATKIVDHYFMREIGLETPALFKHYAKVTMQEIMERYLPKIYSNFLEYDPLSNVDFTEEFTREIIGSSNSRGSSSSNSTQSSVASSDIQTQQDNESLNIVNRTPQKNITRQDLDTGAYASEVGQNDNKITGSQVSGSNTSSNATDNTNVQNSGNSNTVEKFTRHEEGDNGVIITNQRLVKEYREIIVAIDEEIINELSVLFMGIY